MDLERSQRQRRVSGYTGIASKRTRPAFGANHVETRSIRETSPQNPAGITREFAESAGRVAGQEVSANFEMDKFRIRGGKPLHGTVRISGAKNSALPAMAAALLTAEPVTLHNIPKVRDIITMSKLLAFMSANVSAHEIPAESYTIETKSMNDAVAPYELVKTMRASILTLGPAIARSGVAHVSLPGGCAIGARPVDLHLAALEKMGAVIATSHGYIEARVPGLGSGGPGGRLKGAHIVFEKITVTGTENILMAATLADGETTLENCAREPEVTDLVVMLRKMGAQIEGDGTATLRIRGVPELHGTEHRVIPDRIETGTFLVAGAITGGDVTLTNCEPN